MNGIAHFRTLLAEVRRRLLAHPNVTGVGLGTYPGTGRLGSGSLSWRVYVKCKLPDSGISASTQLPKSLFGLRTYVVCAQPSLPTSGEKEPPIYTAGIQIESDGSITGAGAPQFLQLFTPSGIGTLGCFARLKTGKKAVLLTNSHVMFPGYRVFPSTAIYQPTHSSCCLGGDLIARPIYNRNKPARNVANPGAREDLYDGYRDGKWFGGFNMVLGETWEENPVTGGWTKSKLTLHCSKTDCAIAMLAPGVRFNNVFKGPDGEIITINGVNNEPISVLGPTAGTPPAYREYVRVLSKRGLIYGTMLSRIAPDGIPQSVKRLDRFGKEHTVTPIFDVGYPANDADEVGTKTLINQFLILPRPTPPKPKPGQTDDDYRKSNDYTKLYTPNQIVNFDFGDSGSIVIDHEGRVVAQVALKKGLVADTDALRADRDLIELKSVNWIAIATPIQEILDLLDIEIPEGGYSGTVSTAGSDIQAFASGFPERIELAAQRPNVEQVREGLRATRRGKLLLGKIGQHYQEVRRLLTTVRAISAAWRDLNGPRFYHHCVQSARDAEHLIPTSINGVTRSQLAEVLLPLFARHGSLELRRDIDRYGGWAGEALLHISTLDEVPESVARRRPPQ